MMTGFIGVRPTANTQAPNVSLGSIQSGITNAGKLFGAGALGLADELKQRRDADRVASVAGALASLGLNKDSVEGNYRDGMNKLIMAGATPQEALGLMKERVSPMLSDIGIGQKNRALDQTNKALGLQELGLMAKTATQPKTGYTKSFDVDTGTYSTPVFEGLTPEQLRKSSGKVDTITFTGRDGAGREVTYVAPKNADGTVDVSKSQVLATKAPNLSEQDKKFLDNFGRVGTDIRNAAKIASGDKFSGAVGPFDSLYNEYVGRFYKSADHQEKAKLDALSASISAGIVKEFGANPSNLDLQKVMQQVPETGDTEAIFRDKLARFSSVYNTAQAREFNRIANSNPEAVYPLIERMRNDTSLIPVGYVLDDGRDENGNIVSTPKLVPEEV
jgi:hypothetical protein